MKVNFVSGKLKLKRNNGKDIYLGKKEQTILFLNRRGFSPSIICKECEKKCSPLVNVGKLTKDQAKSLDSYKDKEVVLGVRPEDIYFNDCLLKLNYSNEFEMKSDISELLGRELLVYNYLGDQKVTVKTTSGDVLEEGEVKKYRIDLDRIHFFDKDTTLRI